MIVGVQTEHMPRRKPDGLRVVPHGDHWGLQFYAADRPAYLLFFDTEREARVCAGKLLAESGFSLVPVAGHE